MQPGQFNPGGFDFVRELQNLKAEVGRQAAANPFATMGIAPKDGGIDVQGFINSLRTDGTVSLSMDDDGAFTVYGPDGTTAVARLGPLDNSSPGNYGVEIFYAGAWVQVGAGNVDWGNISNIPAAFAPSAHTHAGGDVTSQVAAAAQADGSQYGWTNNVAGTEFYALWVGNDGGYHLGRNVSSIKYKENVTDATVAPEDVLALQPVKYDRKPTYRYPEDTDGNRLIGPEQKFEGAKNQYGLVAEEVAALVPELVTRFGGEIDGVSYEMLGVALLPVVKQQAADIAALKQAVRDLGGTI